MRLGKAARALACALMLFPSMAFGADGTRIVGSWVVTAKEDRFGDGGSFAAITSDGDSRVLAVRCIQKVLTIAIGLIGDDPKSLTQGQIFGIKLRTDKEPVMATVGIAITGRLIQVETMADMVRTIRKGKETAVRIENEDGVSETVVFKTKDTGRAFARIAEECSLD